MGRRQDWVSEGGEEGLERTAEFPSGPGTGFGIGGGDGDEWVVCEIGRLSEQFDGPLGPVQNHVTDLGTLAGHLGEQVV
jgi:hypothetical protein